MTPPATTPWPRFAVLLCAGMVLAFQVGKVPPAVLVLHASLGIDAVAAGWTISLFAVIGAVAGVVFGGFADRIGHRRAIGGGFACIAVASGCGSFCTAIGPLLVTRVFEGFGFFAVAVAMPAVIAALAAPAQRRFALAIWSSYMPLGIALALGISPAILAAGGWPGLWRVASLAAAVAGTAAVLAVRGDAARTITPAWRSIGAVAGARRPLAAGAIFAAYTAIYFAITGFMPAIIAAAGAGAAAAGSLSAAVAILNGCGNVLAGLVARYASRFVILTAGFITVAAGGGVFFLTGMPLPLRLVAAAIGMCAAGMIPGTVTGSIVAIAPAPRLVSTTQGFVQQLASVGQLAGPPLLAYAGATRGGGSGALVIGTLAAAGIAAAAVLSRTLPVEARAQRGR